MANLINLANADIDTDVNLEGYDVYGADDRKLGDIDGVIADGDTLELRYLVIDSGGWFSSKQFVVPAGDVSRIDDDDRRVYFRQLTKDTLESGNYPRYDESWWDKNAHGDFANYEHGVAQAYAPAPAANSKPAKRADHAEPLYTTPKAGAQRLQLLEERLRVNKERYVAGEVRLGKRIVEHEESVTVPLREERVIIERSAGSGEPVQDAVDLRDGETIQVDVMRERASLQKDVVVAEEVAVRTEATERDERVGDTVRREELVVEGDQALMQDANRAGGRTTPESDRTKGGRAGDAVHDAANAPHDRTTDHR